MASSHYVDSTGFHLRCSFLSLLTFIVSKFNIRINVNCTFCDSQPETVLHLFWHCVHTRKLWQDICQFIVNFIHNDFELFFKDVLFGIFTFEKQYGNIYFLCNLIILLAKYFIHKCKVMKVTPNFSYFQEDIKMYIKSLSTSYNKKAIQTLCMLTFWCFCIICI